MVHIKKKKQLKEKRAHQARVPSTSLTFPSRPSTPLQGQRLCLAWTPSACFPQDCPFSHLQSCPASLTPLAQPKRILKSLGLKRLSLASPQHPVSMESLPLTIGLFKKNIHLFIWLHQVFVANS